MDEKTISYRVVSEQEKRSIALDEESEIDVKQQSKAIRVAVGPLFELLKKQEYKCALSGRELSPDNCEADHVIPVSRGGSNTMENIQLVRSEVNAAKGTMTLDEFISMCNDVANHRW